VTLAVLAVAAATVYVCVALARSTRGSLCLGPGGCSQKFGRQALPSISTHQVAFRNGTTVSGGGATMLMTRCAHSAKASCSSVS